MNDLQKLIENVCGHKSTTTSLITFAISSSSYV